MKTTDSLVEALENLSLAVEAAVKAEKVYETTKSKVILNDSVYAAAKNEHVRNAYLEEKLVKEKAALNIALEAKRKAAVIKDIAEVEWKSEKYDIMLSVGKIV